MLKQWWRKHTKSGELKYTAPNINVYVLMIFIAFSMKRLSPLPPFFLLCKAKFRLGTVKSHDMGFLSRLRHHQHLPLTLKTVKLRMSIVSP